MKKIFFYELFSVLVIFLGLAVVPCWAQSNAVTIAYLKKVDVSTIDPKLASMPYESWLNKTLGANAAINWEVDDCGEGGDRKGPVPMCVTAFGKFKKHGEATLSIAVGSSDKGIIGTPILWNLYVQGNGPSRSFNSLHELPDYLREIDVDSSSTITFSDKLLDEKSAVNFAKNIDIRTFVSAQPKQTFLSWIEGVAGTTDRVTWKLDGCDQAAISMQLSGERDYRACVVTHFENKNESVLLLIYVGTYRKGLVVAPKITLVQVYNKRRANHGITVPAIDELPGILVGMRHVGRLDSGKVQ